MVGRLSYCMKSTCCLVWGIILIEGEIEVLSVSFLFRVVCVFSIF